MRHTVVTLVATSMLVIASLVATPSNAQSQVIIIIGNGSAQPYYPPPYPHPYPHPYEHTHVLYGAGYYPQYGYPTSDYGGGYYPQYGHPTSDYGYYNGYYNGGYDRHYGYGW